MEFKYDENLKNKLSACVVLLQCVFYLKKFELNGEKLPSTIFIGDKNECFVLHTNDVIKYLAYDIKWNIVPSEAHKVYPSIIMEMTKDDNIAPYINDITEDFKLQNVISKIEDLTKSVIRLIRITSDNINNIYTYFNSHVIAESKLSVNGKINLFIQIICNPDENYLHPKKKNVLITKNYGDIRINSDVFVSFFRHFEGNKYSPSEKEKLLSITDRLIEDTVRRNKGEFYTPTDFVNLANKYIENTFGKDWKDRYIVWDCCSGQSNITRDYNFKELYCSTLEQSDIDSVNSLNINSNAIKFQYDFLNDDDSKLPQQLLDGINSGKEILFFINPPYLKASTMTEGDNTGISSTMIGNIMNQNKMGIASSQLSSQFLYKILQMQNVNKNIKVALFNSPNFLSGGGFGKFRNVWLNKFKYETGFLFQASHFADVSDKWGISFSIWNNDISINKNDFLFDIIDYNDNFVLSKINDKIVYNCDDLVKANVFFKDDRCNNTMMPSMKSALTISDKTKVGDINAIGYINNHSNNQMQQNVIFLCSLPAAANGNKTITSNIFFKAISLFTARKSIQGNWVNDKDEYIAPNENHPLYKQFEIDSIVYSLFNNSSQQSSLRNIDYKGDIWNIKNEFFWIAKDDVKNIADNTMYDELYQDAKNCNSERYVYNLLFGEQRLYDKLSPDAKEVLDMATSLLYKSIEQRKLSSMINPNYHLNSWDCGYAQLKLVWKEYLKDDFKVFRDKYKAFENRMKPLVYELGFLKS